MLRHIQALLRHMEGALSDIFKILRVYKTLRNTSTHNCVIFRTLGYLEPEVSRKAFQTCQMIGHIRG